MESERELVDESGGAQRGMAVDSGVGEAEVGDRDRWIRILHCHYLLLHREREREFREFR